MQLDPFGAGCISRMVLDLVEDDDAVGARGSERATGQEEEG